MAIILYGKEPAQEIKTKVKNRVEELYDTYGRRPSLWVFSIGDDPASKVYINGKKKDCEECGIDFNHVKISENADPTKVKEIIDSHAEIDLINAIEIGSIAKILQLPIPKKYNTDELIKDLDQCDADGFTAYNTGRLFNGLDGVKPCTAEGIIKLLKYYGVHLQGKNITIIGRSRIVGRPLSIMLSDEDATVTLCHSKTTNLQDHTKNADIIVSAVGKLGLITPNMINSKSILVDVGINRNQEGKLVGDVNPECYNYCAAYTPVPGGIGLMTRAVLMENTLKIFEDNFVAPAIRYLGGKTKGC